MNGSFIVHSLKIVGKMTENMLSDALLSKGVQIFFARASGISHQAPSPRSRIDTRPCLEPSCLLLTSVARCHQPPAPAASPRAPRTPSSSKCACFRLIRAGPATSATKRLPTMQSWRHATKPYSTRASTCCTASSASSLLNPGA